MLYYCLLVRVYLLLGWTYTTPKAFELYFKGPSSSFSLAIPYSIWEHQNFPLNRGIPDGVNTLIYTVLKHFVGTSSNISSQISDYLNNLRCPTMSGYR